MTHEDFVNTRITPGTDVALVRCSPAVSGFFATWQLSQIPIFKGLRCSWIVPPACTGFKHVGYFNGNLCKQSRKFISASVDSGIARMQGSDRLGAGSSGGPYLDMYTVVLCHQNALFQACGYFKRQPLQAVRVFN